MYICKMYRVNSSSEEVSHHHRSFKSLELWKFTSTKIFTPFVLLSCLCSSLPTPPRSVPEYLYSSTITSLYHVLHDGGKMKQKKTKNQLVRVLHLVLRHHTWIFFWTIWTHCSIDVVLLVFGDLIDVYVFSFYIFNLSNLYPYPLCELG